MILLPLPLESYRQWPNILARLLTHQVTYLVVRILGSPLHSAKVCFKPSLCSQGQVDDRPWQVTAFGLCHRHNISWLYMPQVPAIFSTLLVGACVSEATSCVLYAKTLQSWLGRSGAGSQAILKLHLSRRLHGWGCWWPLLRGTHCDDARGPRGQLSTQRGGNAN